MISNKKIVPYICSFIFLFLIWRLAAALIGSSLILPQPASVLKTGIQLLADKIFWKAFIVTFSHIIIAFVISCVMGFITGYIFSENQFIKSFFEPYISIMQITPVVAVILIINFWFKSYMVPIVVSVLMTLPVMTNSVYSGFIAINKKLLEVAKVYNFSIWKTFFTIKLPSAKKGIITGVNSIFGLTWKVVIAGEVLCIPKTSIGTLLQRESIHLETDKVMAVTLLMILISFCMQKIVQGLLSCKDHKNNL